MTCRSRRRPAPREFDSRGAGRVPSWSTHQAPDGKRPAKPAAFVDARQFGDLQAAYCGEQHTHFIKGPRLQLARFRQAQPAEPVAADVNGYALVEGCAQLSDSFHTNLVVEIGTKLRRALGHSCTAAHHHVVSVPLHVHRTASGEHY